MKKSIPAVLILIMLTGVGVFTFDLLFSKPEHLQGIILEKLYVPGRLVSGATPYGGVKRSKYFVTHQKEDQWWQL